MSSDAPIYLVSVPRSGATLLGAMLNTHKSIAMFNEPWFFYMLPKFESLCHQKKVESVLDHLSNAAMRFGVTLAMGFKANVSAEIEEAGLTDPVDILALFMDRYAKHMGKIRWGIKQPFGVFYIPRMLNRFPNVKIIHIVRDPRATVAHRMDKQVNKKEDLVNSLKFSRSFSKMMWFANRARTLNPESYFELRYEDLVVNAEACLRRICEFLEEDYDPDMFEYHKGKSPYVPRGEDGSPKESHLGVLMPLNTRYVGLWRTLLTLRETAIVEKVCLHAMVPRGYYPITSGQEIGAILSLKTAIRFWWNQANLFVRQESFERMLYKYRNGLVLYHN